jgi:hypothetical protein
MFHVKPLAIIYLTTEVKHPLESRPRDRPANVVITEKMVNEATRVLWRSGLVEYCSEADKLVVKEMLRMAMPLARPILNKNFGDPSQVSEMNSLEQ